MTFDTPDWSQAAPVQPALGYRQPFAVSESGSQTTINLAGAGQRIVPLVVYYTAIMPAAWSPNSSSTTLRGLVTIETSSTISGTSIVPDGSISPEAPFLQLPVVYVPVLAAAEGLIFTGYSQPGAGVQAVTIGILYRLVSV